MSEPKNVSPFEVMRVSVRDRAIYQAVMVAGKQQRVVAIEYKLSQPRVSAIIKRVTRWLSQGDPPGLGELYRRDRLRMVSRLHRMRLEQLYQDAYAAWLKSDETTHMIHEKMVKGEVVSRDTKVHTKPRDMRYVRELRELEDRIAAFEGFDKLGRVDESCTGRIYEEPERTPVDSYREVKRRTILGGFDTPGDEGIPGMWGEEMAQRNEAVRKAERGMRSEGKADVKAWEGEAPAEPNAERQLGEPSLSSVLRGEGRGEGPAPREDQASSQEYAAISGEYRANIPPTTSNNPEILCERNVKNPTPLLSKNNDTSAQVPQQPSLTTSTPPDRSLSKSPPKVPRFRLMGTVGEMLESLTYDDYFDPEVRMMLAYEDAMESQAQDRPLSPTVSPEYRGEGVRQRAPSPQHRAT